MGWSCTTAAGDTLDVIERACDATRRANGLEKTSNVFFANGKRYFYEVTRKDQQDGGIAGAIFLCVGDDLARKAGTFRIDGRGNVVRGPALFRHAERRALVADGKVWMKRELSALPKHTQEGGGA